MLAPQTPRLQPGLARASIGIRDAPNSCAGAIVSTKSDIQQYEKVAALDFVTCAVEGSWLLGEGTTKKWKGFASDPTDLAGRLGEGMGARNGVRLQYRKSPSSRTDFITDLKTQELNPSLHQNYFCTYT